MVGATIASFSGTAGSPGSGSRGCSAFGGSATTSSGSTSSIAPTACTTRPARRTDTRTASTGPGSSASPRVSVSGLGRADRGRTARAFTGTRLRRGARARLPRQSCSSTTPATCGMSRSSAARAGGIRRRRPGLHAAVARVGASSAPLRGARPPLHDRRERRNARLRDLPAVGIDGATHDSRVMLDDWPVRDEARRTRFTTVGRWRGGGSARRPRRASGGRSPQKGDESCEMLELPSRRGSRSRSRSIRPAGTKRPRALLEHTAGRSSIPAPSPRTRTASAATSRAPGRSSRSPRGAYVETSTGWFSERTTRYLASGRPALVQDTGFSPNTPRRRGAARISHARGSGRGRARIAADYERHRRAARRIAEEYFDSDKVLTRFLEDALP